MARATDNESLFYYYKLRSYAQFKTSAVSSVVFFTPLSNSYLDKWILMQFLNKGILQAILFKSDNTEYHLGDK
jgi:hypothetical protein